MFINKHVYLNHPMKTRHRALFKEIGEEGNEKLKDHQITIVGLGSVGSEVAEVLAREDFELRLIDRGRVEEEDMSRLNLFEEEDITKFKVKQAKKRIEEINSQIKIKIFHEDLNEENVFLVKSELVIDSSNQPETNNLVFKYCQDNKVPLIYVRYSGAKVKVLVANKKLTQKNFDALNNVGNVTEEGVISPTTMLGSMIVIKRVFKYFLGDKASYLIEADAWEGKIKVTKL